MTVQRSTVAAFRKAFGASSDAQLIVRVNHAEIPELADGMEALARAFAKPIISTSATVHDKTLHNADDISLHLGHGLDLILDGEHIDAPPSSVVDLTGPYPVVVREGAGDLSWIEV